MLNVHKYLRYVKTSFGGLTKKVNPKYDEVGRKQYQASELECFWLRWHDVSDLDDTVSNNARCGLSCIRLYCIRFLSPLLTITIFTKTDQMSPLIWYYDLIQLLTFWEFYTKISASFSVYMYVIFKGAKLTIHMPQVSNCVHCILSNMLYTCIQYILM